MKFLFVRRLMILLAILTLLGLASCDSSSTYDALYGFWQVDSIENPNSTGTLSEPWIKLSSDAWVTFVYYDSAEWRHCTMRSGQVTGINADSITFTEDESGSSMTVAYSYDGTTFSITWPNDGEIYHMTSASDLPFPETSAISSPCFN